MHPGKLLLRAVIDHPDEDTPRAMLADYLQLESNVGSQWYGGFIAAQLLGQKPEIEHLAKLLGYVTYDLGNPETCLVFLDGPDEVPDEVPEVNPRNVSLETRLLRYQNCRVFGDIHSRRDLPFFYVNRGFVWRVDSSIGMYMLIADRLLSRHPIVSVRINNCLPQVVDSRSWRWWRSDVGVVNTNFTLPAVIFDAMPTGDVQYDDNPMGRAAYRVFATEKDAVHALEAACLRYGRKQGDLRLNNSDQI